MQANRMGPSQAAQALLARQVRARDTTTQTEAQLSLMGRLKGHSYKSDRLEYQVTCMIFQGCTSEGVLDQRQYLCLLLRSMQLASAPPSASVPCRNTTRHAHGRGTQNASRNKSFTHHSGAHSQSVSHTCKITFQRDMQVHKEGKQSTATVRVALL